MEFIFGACCDSCHVIKGSACQSASFAQRARCRNLWMHLALLTVLVVLVVLAMLVTLVVLVVPAHTDPLLDGYY